MNILLEKGFPGGSDGKESACNAGNPGSVLGLGRSTGERNGNLFQYSCLGNAMKSLAGYSPLGCKQTRLSDSHTHTVGK